MGSDHTKDESHGNDWCKDDTNHNDVTGDDNDNESREVRSRERREFKAGVVESSLGVPRPKRRRSSRGSTGKAIMVIVNQALEVVLRKRRSLISEGSPGGYGQETAGSRMRGLF
jgi:hypothetical protein